jgi:hypothetical protein
MLSLADGVLCAVLCCVVLRCAALWYADEESDADPVKDTASTPTGAGAVGSKRPAVLADGTYATQVGTQEKGHQQQQQQHLCVCQYLVW